MAAEPQQRPLRSRGEQPSSFSRGTLSEIEAFPGRPHPVGSLKRGSPDQKQPDPALPLAVRIAAAAKENPMATMAASAENSRQGINSEIPPCIGLDTRLSLSARPGYGYVYDETPAGLVVYVRNDPLNLVDPDGRQFGVACAYMGREGGCNTWLFYWIGSGGGNPDEYSDDGSDYDPMAGDGEPATPSISDLINSAVTMARGLLTGDCAEFLQGNYDGNLSDLLGSMQQKGWIRPIDYQQGSLRDGKVDVTIAWTAGSLIYVNKYGPFENPTNTFLRTPSGVTSYDYLAFWNRTFNTSFDADQMRAAVILHELGHVTGKFGEDPGSASMDNTRNVISKCFK